MSQSDALVGATMRHQHIITCLAHCDGSIIQNSSVWIWQVHAPWALNALNLCWFGCKCIGRRECGCVMARICMAITAMYGRLSWTMILDFCANEHAGAHYEHVTYAWICRAMLRVCRTQTCFKKSEFVNLSLFCPVWVSATDWKLQPIGRNWASKATKISRHINNNSYFID